MSVGHGLSGEQLLEAERLYHLGQTKGEILSAIGARAWEEARRPAGPDRPPGPLSHLPSRQGQRADLHGSGLKLFVEKANPAIIAEVELRRQQVCAGWDDSTRAQRMGLPPNYTPWDSAGFAPCPARGSVPVKFSGTRPW